MSRAARRRGSAVALALGVSLSGLASSHAADAPTATSGTERSAGAADLALGSGTAQLFEQAGERYAEHAYGQALELLQLACRESTFDGCELNLGAVHHALKHCSEARQHYTAYLQLHPNGRESQAARAALDELDAHCEQASQAVAPALEGPQPPHESGSLAAQGASTARDAGASAAASPEAASAPVPDPGAPRASWLQRRAVPLLLTGAGALAGVSTLLFATELSSTNSQIEQHRAQPFDPEQAQRLRHSEQFEALTWAGGVVTVALLGAGTTVWLLTPDENTAVDFSAGAAPGLTLRHRF